MLIGDVMWLILQKNPKRIKPEVNWISCFERIALYYSDATAATGFTRRKTRTFGIPFNVRQFNQIPPFENDIGNNRIRIQVNSC